MEETRAAGPREPGREVQCGALLGPGCLRKHKWAAGRRCGPVSGSVSALNPTSSLLEGLETAPFPAGLQPAVGIGALGRQSRKHPFSFLPACCPHAGTGDILSQDSWQDWRADAGFSTSEVMLLLDSWEP